MIFLADGTFSNPHLPDTMTNGEETYPVVQRAPQVLHTQNLLLHVIIISLLSRIYPQNGIDRILFEPNDNVLNEALGFL